MTARPYSSDEFRREVEIAKEAEYPPDSWPARMLASMVLLRTEIARLSAALQSIEAGRPAGSAESTLASDGTWREYCRSLQRIAREALK